jgi:hypothetical protein
MGITGCTLRLKHQASRQMKRAIRLEADTLFFNRHMGVNGTLEIFLLKLAEAVLDVLAQSVANVEVFSGNLDLHGRRKYPCFALFL